MGLGNSQTENIKKNSSGIRGGRAREGEKSAVGELLTISPPQSPLDISGGEVCGQREDSGPDG